MQECELKLITFLGQLGNAGDLTEETEMLPWQYEFWASTAAHITQINIKWLDGWVDGSSGKDFCRMYHLYTLLQYLTSVPPKNLYWCIIGMPAVSRLLAQSNLQPLCLVHTSLKSKKKHNSRWFILATSCLLQVPLVDRKMMVNKLWALMLVHISLDFKNT